MNIDPESLDRRERYRLLISAIVPRPIAWVTTVDAAGRANAAPFSFFGGISASPPRIMVSVGSRREAGPKDTARNAMETGEMVVNVATYDLRREMVGTAEGLPPGESEIEHLGLETAPSEVVAPPRLAASPVNLECRVEQTIRLDTSHVIFGRVVRIHVRDDLLTDGAIDVAALRPLGRLGGSEYLDIEEGILTIER